MRILSKFTLLLIILILVGCSNLPFGDKNANSSSSNGEEVEKSEYLPDDIPLTEDERQSFSNYYEHKSLYTYGYESKVNRDDINAMYEDYFNNSEALEEVNVSDYGEDDNGLQRYKFEAQRNEGKLTVSTSASRIKDNDEDTSVQITLTKKK